MTICFGIHDNLKATEIENLTIAGVPLVQILPFVGLTASDLWRENESRSMWNARLFPSASSPSESSEKSLKLVEIVRLLQEQNKVGKGGVPSRIDWQSEKRFSLNEASELKVKRKNIGVTSHSIAIPEFLIINEMEKLMEIFF